MSIGAAHNDREQILNYPISNKCVRAEKEGSQGCQLIPQAMSHLLGGSPEKVLGETFENDMRCLKNCHPA